MTELARTNTRDIARTAVRAELAQVAFDLFVREGFENVTINDLATAAGVSRSTFLRYFGSKEDAVLGAIDAQGDQVANALRARPADEDDWTALRRGLDTVIEPYRQDPANALATTRLVQETPALCARKLEKQHSWRPALAQALAERGDAPRPATLALSVRAAAALDCLNIALDHWTASDGRLDLVDLLDEAFAALAPAPRRPSSSG
ncbi:TetR/AcrR family transcriptional regulator [Pseudofrankia sp. BMG5.36]|uniref:TetR/AcrR family transcriptional regulator n=1 Tax=Pseudofrankia sp. BMG5.36 TaxID=1834512 RepID=UPI0008DB2713|nr:TetR/AcrR family transcriptional regulator [Pseudofrankia sp. BMG5.36]OHV43821.1 transcriptional regulator [Pseudofrankia sp. BMG5.36]